MIILWLSNIFQSKKDLENGEVDIAKCSRGQYFGELALVTNKPRAASAYAVDNVKCLGTDTSVCSQSVIKQDVVSGSS